MPFLPDASDASLAPRPVDRVVAVALVVVVVFGVVARLIGQTSIELWADEADWALRAAQGTDTFIRPAGSMWLAKHTIALHNSEVVLRLPSLIAGIFSLPLLFAILRRLVRPAVAVVAVVVLAVHPVALAMAREFKPYAVEATLHLLVLWLALRMLHGPPPSSSSSSSSTPETSSAPLRRALALVTTTTLAPLLSWSIVFSYPGAFGFSLLARRRGLHDRAERRPLLVLLGGMLTTLLLLGVLFAARVGGEDRKTEYWGDKYGVFYTGDDVVGLALFLVRKLVRVLTWPARLDVPRGTFYMVLQYGFVALVVVGVLVLIVRRRATVLMVLVLPFVTTVVFNVLGQWPWGVFRTNFYLVPLTLVLVAVGADVVVDVAARVHRWLPRVLALLVTIAVLAGVPRWWGHFDEKIRGSQTGQAQMHHAMGLLRAVETKTPTPAPDDGVDGVDGDKRVLLLDGHACGLFTYYKDHHDGASAEHRAWFDAHINPRCGELNKQGWYPVLDEAQAPFWVIVVQRALEGQTVKRLSERCTVSHKHRLRGMTLLHCGAKKS